MKLFLITLSMISVMVASQKSEACSPPRQAYMIQSIETKALFSDTAVHGKILEFAGESAHVNNVKYENGGYTITLSNKCEFYARPVWEKPESGGMCPRFNGFKVSKNLCTEN